MSTTHSSLMGYQTRQREAVFRVLEEDGKPLTALVILERARKYCAGIGIATVFRTLK